MIIKQKTKYQVMLLLGLQKLEVIVGVLLILIITIGGGGITLDAEGKNMLLLQQLLTQMLLISQ
ncbi:hypothetical protein [Prevotella sp.]|uniref:hypothetical protein n=1 Tax=Prevotella sp. TaxID=59823 RepID=UPI0027E29C07|nr:hypothetical protein [Prevotella sp.]